MDITTVFGTVVPGSSPGGRTDSRMKWVAISGSWRNCTTDVAHDVRADVATIMQRGDGIVSGGALGVDYCATEEAMKHDRECKRIRIYLPTTLERYLAHYQKRSEEGVISSEQAQILEKQLTLLKKRNPAAIIEHPKNSAPTKETYYERNTAIILASDELLAYHVNNSEGTQDAITKAKARNIPTTVHVYTAS